MLTDATSCVKEAETLRADVPIVSEQDVPLEESHPLQPENVQPDEGEAERETFVPCCRETLQVLPQLMPLPVTVPEPFFETESV